MNTRDTDNSAGRDVFSHSRISVIEPMHGWRALDVREIWAYRELLWMLAARDVRVRYKQTALGAGWALLRPLLTMAIFSFVFGKLAKLPSDGMPYPVFVFAGLLPWLFFSSSVSTSGQSVISARQLVSKVYFPRLIIPLSSIGASLVDLIVATAALIVLMLVYEIRPTAAIAALPLMFLAVILTSLAVGTMLSALTAVYRDFTHVTPFLVQIWMYVTPVIFPLSLLPEEWRLLAFLNPMTGIVEGFRFSLLGTPLHASGFALSMFVASGLMFLAIAYFERVEHEFADVV